MIKNIAILVGISSILAGSLLTASADPYAINQSIINLDKDSISVKVDSNYTCIESQTIQKAVTGWVQGPHNDGITNFWGETQCPESRWTWHIQEKTQGRQATIYCSATPQGEYLTCGIDFSSSTLPVHLLWATTTDTTNIQVGVE